MASTVSSPFLKVQNKDKTECGNSGLDGATFASILYRMMAMCDYHTVGDRIGLPHPHSERSIMLFVV